MAYLLGKPESAAAKDKCVLLPVLTYHHIQGMKEAGLKKQLGLTVSVDNFQKQIDYLKKRGYETVLPSEINRFFRGEGELPKKGIMITIDDAYIDSFEFAWPILKERGYKAVVFAPTGLLDNPDYLSWRQAEEMNQSGTVYFGNHTWSHAAASEDADKMEKEIGLGENQLKEKGMDGEKVFAYPFGKVTKTAGKILLANGYSLAFTTRRGKVLCNGQRMNLPRIQIGNGPMSRYGL